MCQLVVPLEEPALRRVALGPPAIPPSCTEPSPPSRFVRNPPELPTFTVRLPMLNTPLVPMRRIVPELARVSVPVGLVETVLVVKLTVCAVVTPGTTVQLVPLSVIAPEKVPWLSEVN